MPVKLLIYLAVWKRPEITEICFMGINRLRKSGLFPIEAFAVISEVEMIPLCRRYGIDWCITDNEKLGRKKNFGLSKAMEKDFDYMIEIGSDDLLKTDILFAYEPYFGHNHIIGLNRFYYLNSEDLECREYRNSSLFGIGRAVSRYAIEKVGNLWKDDLNVGLDNNSLSNLVKRGFMDVRIDRPLGIDIKSEVNIKPFNYLDGVKVDFETVVEGLSSKEIEAIRALQHAEAQN